MIIIILIQQHAITTKLTQQKYFKKAVSYVYIVGKRYLVQMFSATNQYYFYNLFISWQQQQLEERLSPFTKRILIVDNDPDITLTFKKAFEEVNRIGGNKSSFQVNTYNDPIVALSEFKPGFYDLMLIDINMPKMNGFDFCVKVLEIDINPRVCFMSSGLINQEALREQYPSLSIGCFIRKPITIENLVRKVKTELN